MLITRGELSGNTRGRCQLIGTLLQITTVSIGSLLLVAAQRCRSLNADVDR
jgi:hypothetical protein